MQRFADGHREYKLKHFLECDPEDGPFSALNTPGLPLPGSIWAFGGEIDPWAYCEQTATITPSLANEPNRNFTVEQTFSTRAPSRCQDTTIEDPLLEPPEISGSFVSKVEEALKDRFGRAILTSSHEMIRGPQNEWDVGQDTIKIVQNVASAYLGYVLPLRFKNCVNAFSIWGIPPRCVKLNSSPWERKFFGSCNIYYRRTLEFGVDFRTHDRDILDEGTKALSGHFDRITGNYVLDLIAGALPQYYNPQHFIRFKDRNGENTRVVLNGHGVPASVRVVSQRIVPAQVNEYAPIGAGGDWFTDPGGAVQRFFGNIGPPVSAVINVETSGPHGLATGQTITMQDVLGFQAERANGQWIVDVVDAIRFRLRGSDGGNPGDIALMEGGRYRRAGGINSVADNVTPVLITSTAHGLATGQGIFVQNTGAAGIDDGAWVVTVVDANHFSLDGSVGQSSIPSEIITGATNASPISVNSVSHGRTSGQTVQIEGALGNTAANGTYAITVVDADNFTLNSSSGNGVWTSGGRWTLVGTETITEDTQPGHIHVEKYTEVDFLQLGIPLTF